VAWKVREDVSDKSRVRVEVGKIREALGDPRLQDVIERAAILPDPDPPAGSNPPITWRSTRTVREDGQERTRFGCAVLDLQPDRIAVAYVDDDGDVPRTETIVPLPGGLLMRSVTYSMGVSLDGYIVGPDGGFEWTAPDEEVFRFVTEEIREVGVYLLGRRLYETMLYWETADQDPSLDDSMLEWAALWKRLPKVVFSTTLSALQGHARLASGGLAEEIERLRAEPGEGNIAIGGATLAAEAAALGLIDEYRARVHPVLVGGGIPFFPQRERRVNLELVETRTFISRVVYLRYRVARLPGGEFRALRPPGRLGSPR
jgi:dihydrofolate reductase